MSCRCCCSCCDKERRKRRAELYQAEFKRLLPKVGLTKSEKKFAWLPTRCPKSRTWYWLQHVIKISRSRIGTAMIGSVVLPGLVWDLTEVIGDYELS